MMRDYSYVVVGEVFDDDGNYLVWSLTVEAPGIVSAKKKAIAEIEQGDSYALHGNLEIHAVHGAFIPEDDIYDFI